jgi:hypothetical protein
MCVFVFNFEVMGSIQNSITLWYAAILFFIFYFLFVHKLSLFHGLDQGYIPLTQSMIRPYLALYIFSF